MEPLYSHVNDIFENDKNVSDDLLILHHWDSYSNKYYKNISENVINENTMYGKIVNSLFNSMNVLPYEYFLKNQYQIFYNGGSLYNYNMNFSDAD